MKIAIAVPSHDTVPAPFAFDLAKLVIHTAAQMPAGWEFGVNAVVGTYVHQARQELIDNLVRQGVDYILWLDSDMRFPREALFHLLQHRKDVVGINYAKRQVPTEFVALKKVGAPRGERCITRETSTGLEEVEALGFGCVLIRTSCLKDLPDPKDVPWFQNVHLGEGRWMGEDVWFCAMLRKAGVKIYVDHDLSKVCGHVGQFDFQCIHAETELPAEAVAA